MVALGAVAASVGAGMVNVALGIFIKPIAEEFGWQRGVMSYAFSIWAICSGVGSIVLGRLIQRWGIRPPTAIFLAVYAASIAAVAFIPGSSPAAFYAIQVVSGFAGAAATVMPYSVAVVTAFDKQRGLALSLLISGSGLGLVVLPHYTNYLLSSFGWRAGYLGMAAVVAAVSLGILFIVRFPSSGAAPAPASDAPRSGGRPWAETAAILTDRSFWKIAFAIFSLITVLTVVYINLVPMMTDRGMSVTEATILVSTVGAGSWLARLSVGPIMDRIHAPYVGAAVILISLAGAALLVLPLPFKILGAVLLGVGVGAEAELVTFISSRYFPARMYSQVVGMIWAFWAWGTAGAGVIAGFVFDLTQSYDAAIAATAVLALLGIPALLLLGPYLNQRQQPMADRTANSTQAAIAP